MKVVFVLTLSALFVGTQAQEGETFPDITGETVEGSHVTIPQDTKGKITLVGIATSRKTEDALESWFQPCYDKFIAKAGMFDEMYDAHVHFIPMFGGANATLMNASMKQLRSSGNTEIYPHVLYWKGDLKPYTRALGMSSKDIPYFFVLDKDGKVIHKISGRYSEDKMEVIEEILLE